MVSINVQLALNGQGFKSSFFIKINCKILVTGQLKTNIFFAFKYNKACPSDHVAGIRLMEQCLAFLENGFKHLDSI